jgi:triosephosphate isomerase
MRKKIVAGNWKMNGTYTESITLFNALRSSENEFPPNVEVMVAPPFLYLQDLHKIGSSRIKVISQNCSSKSKGAFTGEISAAMLRSISIDCSIVGHSERRLIYKESISDISEKVKQLLSENMQVIFCVGEQLEERKSGNHFKVIDEQLSSIYSIDPSLFSKVVVAYEPVWAIGTGETASPEQAQEMHSFIRSKLREFYANAADQTRILYGGSVKPDNAVELFMKADVDGGLVGGAALQASDFIKIIQAAG